jgi:hypothetical protein
MSLGPIKFTNAPRRYVTGGVFSTASAVEACNGDTLIYPLLDNLGAGGPLDAPDYMPTGAVFVSHGVRFFGMAARDA